MLNNKNTNKIISLLLQILILSLYLGSFHAKFCNLKKSNGRTKGNKPAIKEIHKKNGLRNLNNGNHQ